MKKEKQRKTIEEHVWTPLRKRELTPQEEFEFLMALEGGMQGTEGMIGLLQKLNPNEFLPVSQLRSEEKNVQPFNDYIRALRYCELDVGKGNAEYGFKMPLPENGQTYRELIIFRRRKTKN